MKLAALALKQSVHFLGVSTSETYEAINLINEEAKLSFGGKYIPALPTNKVTIASGDPFLIHHDKTTVESIINTIKNHLN